MITDKELNISSLSYLHKDFYQIYPEILDLVKKITERWDPASSNESDPGVVLLKLLAFIADKNNYNIDKNILECFMPSCTQEESMRKLCDMMGYNMHYYTSATTSVSFMWSGDQVGNQSDWQTAKKGSIYLPAFKTTLSDESGNVNFVLTEDVELSYKYQVNSGQAIQGTYTEVQLNDDNIIKISNLDDNNRFYLPEIQIAQNGIWVKDATTTSIGGSFWTRVENLNIQQTASKVWKFCYDSKRKLPYIQFPEDVSDLMTDGIYISYVRTSGANGNISAKTLTKISNATTVIHYFDGKLSYEEVNIEEDNNTYLNVQNPSSTLNGKDLETIDQAYEGFKKTVGTFDTLVTCRDYANTIYNMVYSETNSNNLVSNVQVTDIRSDFNLTNKIITFDSYGLVYEDVSEKYYDYEVFQLDTTGEKDKIYHLMQKQGDTEPGYYTYDTEKNKWKKSSSADRISNFDLYLYPLNPINDKYDEKSYISSFKPNTSNLYEIKNQLNDYKTISHQIKQLSSLHPNDIYYIKNYYKLKGFISTTYKVNKYEEKEILSNIQTALYKNFNARKVDFGKEIPYDALVECIEKADARIKLVSLEEPTITPYYMTVDTNEKLLYNTSPDVNWNGTTMYEKLLRKNILAGRLPLLKYDTRFNYHYGETNAKYYTTESGSPASYEVVGGKMCYPVDSDPEKEPTNVTRKNSVAYIKPELNIPLQLCSGKTYTLEANEQVQLIAPNYTSLDAYAAYVNYYFIWDKTEEESSKATPCKITGRKYYIGTVEKDVQTQAGFEDWYQNRKDTNTFIYRKSVNPNYGLKPGRLVDAEYHSYSVETSFNSLYASCYFFLDSSVTARNTLGENASFTSIADGTEYILKNNDKLYLNYTDSNSNIQNIIIDKDGITTNGIIKSKSDLGLEDMIIKPINFNLYDSRDWLIEGSGHKYSKTSGYVFDGHNIPGMFTLNGTEEIDTRDTVKTILKNVTKCYWVTETNKIEFTCVSTSSPYLHEYILGEGEYFFYTDDAMTSLVTLGSGTRLYLKNNSLNPVTWELTNDTKIDLDSVSKNGIGAFSDTDWIYKDFATTNLGIQEMQIISLGEDDSFTGVAFNPEITGKDKLDDNWTPIVRDNFKYNGSNTLTEGLQWYIRSILNINMGPDLIQNLRKGKSLTDVKEQKLTCYTVAWKYKDRYWTGKEDNFPGFNKCEEVILKSHPVEKFIPTVEKNGMLNVALKSNYTIQKSGGRLISVHRYTTDEIPADDTYIYPFYNQGVKVVDKQDDTKEIEMNTYNNIYTKINFDSYKEITLPVCIPTDKDYHSTDSSYFAMISIYYASDSVNGTGATITSGTNEADKYIKEYKVIPAGIAWKHSIELTPNKLNIIVIKQGTNISIDRKDDARGTITIADIDIINKQYNLNNSKQLLTSGIDAEKLKLKYSSQMNAYCNNFLQCIIATEGADDFYYNAPLDQNMLIDNDDLTSYQAWFDTNNVCSKLTIPELNTDFSEITLVKSSKAN